jgi:hypothetical protein
LFFKDVNVVKRIQIIGEHRVSISDERGSGRFCRDILTFTNQNSNKNGFGWNCLFAVKGSTNFSSLEISFPQPTNKQISLLNDSRSNQAGIVLSAWQNIKQNLTDLTSLFIGHLGASALFVEILLIMWVQTPLSSTHNMGLQSL